MRIRPQKAYLLVPIRPPAKSGIQRPNRQRLKEAHDIISRAGIDVECITKDEEDTFYFSNDIAGDLLSITSVHPVRINMLKNILRQRNADGSAIDRLIDEGKIGVYTYEGKRFYKRNI